MQWMRLPRQRALYPALLAATVGVGALATFTPPESALFLLNAVFQGLLAAMALLIAGFVFLKQRLGDFERNLQTTYDESRMEIAEYLDRLGRERLLEPEGQRLRGQIGEALGLREKVEVLAGLHAHLTPARIVEGVRRAVEQRFPGTSPKVEGSPYGMVVHMQTNGDRFRIQVDARGARLSRETPDGLLIESPPVSRKARPAVDELLRFADLSFRFDKLLRRLPVREYGLLNAASSRQFSLGFLIIVCFTAAILLSAVMMSLAWVAGPALAAGMAVSLGLSAFGICLLSYMLYLILRS